MRNRMALVALLGAVALLGLTGTAMATDSQLSPAHQASGKKKGKGKKHHKAKHNKKRVKQPVKPVASVKLTGGTATITLSSSAASTLEKAKATLTAAAPATVSGTTVSMPITGGTLNPATGDGTVDLGGGFTFLGPQINLIFFTSQSAVSLESPVTITIGGSKGSNLSANVGSPPLDAPFFTLTAKAPKSAAGTLKLEGIAGDLDSPAVEVMKEAFSGAAFTTSETFVSIAVSASTA